MADDTEPAAGHDSAAEVGHDLGAERTTAPMSEFATRDVAVGFLVLIVGVALAFGLPLLVTP